MFDSFNPKKNSMFWANWAFVIFGIIIIWKYRASGAFWMGIVAFFIFGLRISDNPAQLMPGGTTPENTGSVNQPV